MAIGEVGLIGVAVQVTVLRVAFDLDLNRNKESYLMILDWIRYSSNVKMCQEQRQRKFMLIDFAFQSNDLYSHYLRKLEEIYHIYLYQIT